MLLPESTLACIHLLCNQLLSHFATLNPNVVMQLCIVCCSGSCAVCSSLLLLLPYISYCIYNTCDSYISIFPITYNSYNSLLPPVTLITHVCNSCSYCKDNAIAFSASHMCVCVYKCACYGCAICPSLEYRTFKLDAH